MKKNILFIGIGFLAYFLIFLLVNGYENTEMHPSINKAIVDRFIDKQNDFGFNNVSVNFEKDKYAGDKIIESGWFTAPEAKVMLTPKDWILHGGYSADEPEFKAALRHFYDPVKIDGVTYLTDLVEGIYLYYGKTLPEMDAKEWALSASDNYFNWHFAKSYLRQAFIDTDESEKEKYTAKAYRALGEVLHLFADMGCPPHVRNDAHPPRIAKVFGDPDPYEEIVKSQDVVEYASTNGKPVQSLAAQFRNASNVSDLFEMMALFTNKNFFTEDTKYGVNTTPNINDRQPYTSPQIGVDVQLNSADRYYYKTIEDRQIKMCAKRSFLFRAFGSHTIIDNECVKSQASVLLPTIAEGGANIIRLFIPNISVTISSAKSDGTIKGTVSHQLNSEYQNEIMYNGKIKIYKGSDVIGEADCTNGSFEGKDLFISKDEKIYAQLEFAGLIYKSNEVNVKDAAQLNCNASLSLNKTVGFAPRFQAIFDDGTSMMVTSMGLPLEDVKHIVNFKPENITWKGNNFSVYQKYGRVYAWNAGYDSLEYSIEGTLSSDGEMIEKFTLIYSWHQLSDGNLSGSYKLEEIKLLYFDLRNIPTSNCLNYKLENDPSINDNVAGVDWIRYNAKLTKDASGQYKNVEVIENRRLKNVNFSEIHITFYP